MANESIASVQELVAARQAHGLSIEDMQRQLKLHAKQVRAIEEGDWSALPGLPFVRGTLRNYCKMIGVDVNPLLEAISGVSKPAELRRSSSLQEPLHASGMFGFGNGGSGNLWIWGVLLVAGVIALALFFGRDSDISKVPSWFGGADRGQGPAAGGAKPQSRADGSSTETIAIAPKGATPAGGAAPGAATPATTGGTTPAAAPAPATVDAAAPAATAAAPVTTSGAAGSAPGAAPASAAIPAGAEQISLAPGVNPADTVALVARFDAETWMEIRTGAGKVLYTGTLKADKPIVFATKGALTVVIARPEKAHLDYDGKPVVVKAPPGGSIAKVKLP